MAGPDVKVGDLGEAPVIPLALLIAGGFLAWFGVKYWRSDLAYPSDVVKSVLQGKGLPAGGAVTSSAGFLNSVESSGASSKPSSSSSSVPVPAGAKGNAAQNQNIAKMLTAGYGWAPQQNSTEWNALVDLWDRESGWNQYAKNPGSGAYGIPQSLPASKMASAGPDWMTNPRTQIKWGLAYIRQRYGSPIGAWQHEQTNGWY